MTYPIVIPLHHKGGKFRDDTELRFSLRSIATNFTDPHEVVIVGKKLPDWLTGVRHIEQTEAGLKTALRMACEAFPDGFFWFYDDCCIIRPTTGEDMKVTPACGGWSKPKTGWSRELEKIHQRLLAENRPAHDYSRPHGPYWFDKSMIDEAFVDWPGMKGKFPWESWILSKRDWPRSRGQVKQYYGAFKGAPGSGQRFLNYNDKGNTSELRGLLDGLFPEPSRFEKFTPPPKYDIRVRGVVISLPLRPRWETACIEAMGAVGIDVEPFAGTDSHNGGQPVMPLNQRAFRREFKREMLTGEIGCFSSHIQIAMAAESLPPLCAEFPDWRLVFEDDAIPKDIDGGKVAQIAHIAAQHGYDVVMLNIGRNNRRGSRAVCISPATGNDPFTHAYLINLKGAKEMTRWEMRHPIDLAISKAKQMRVGLLGGIGRFEQRSPADSTESIHRERKYGTVPITPNNEHSPTPMHSSVLGFVQRIATRERISGKSVIEVGSYNVNGSARPIIQAHSPSSYTGVDIAEQPGFVDHVLDASRLTERFGKESFDVVVSTEMLEHAEDWKSAVNNMREILKPGGLIILTARGPGFPIHAHPYDHWRYTTDDVAAMFQDFATLHLSDDTASHPGFLYAGHKRPVELTANPAPVAIPYHSKEAFEHRMVSRRESVNIPSPFAAFYHVAAMGNWKDVVTEQCEVFAKVGIVPFAFLLGSEDDEKWLSEMPVQIIGREEQIHLYETPTLRKLWDWCLQNPSGAVLYCHTKGVSRQNDPNVAPWRQLMMRHVVEKWTENLEKLAVADVAGVNWGGGKKRPHFSGNFWMARADWIVNLPDPWKHRSDGGPVLQGNPWGRMHAEMWLGSRLWHHVENLRCRGVNLWSGPDVFRLLAEDG